MDINQHKCCQCNKVFATKQQHERHKARRIPCVSKDTEMTFSCACGKSYAHNTGLLKHKTKCLQSLKQSTIEALQNKAFKLNNADDITMSSINPDIIKARFDRVDRRSLVEQKKETREWRTYRELYEYIVEQVFFKTPSNCAFYISNFSDENVAVFNDGEVSYSYFKEIVELITDTVNDFMEQMIDNFEIDKLHPFAFIQNLKYESLINDTTQACYNGFKEKIKNFIMKMFKEYKDDIRAVWRHENILNA